MTKCPQCEIDLDNKLACVKCGWQVALQPAEPQPESADNQSRPEVRKAVEKEGDKAQRKAPAERNVEAPAEAQVQLPASTKQEKKAEEPTPEQPSPVSAEAGSAQPEPDQQQPAASPNQSPVEEKDADDKSQAAAQSVAKGEIVLEGSEVGRMAKIEGDNAIAAETVIQHFYDSSPIKEQSRKEDKRSIVEVTTSFPLDIPPFVSEDLPLYIEQLKEERILLISCPDGQIPLAAANAIVAILRLSKDEQKRFLDFNRTSEENANLNIYFFLKRKIVTEEQTIIVIDAVNRKAHTFLDSLIYDATPSSLKSLTDDLRHEELLMVCLVKAIDVESRLENLKREQKLDDESMFAHWRVPFLQPLLKQYFPDRYVELEAQILRQREGQSWSQDDGEFCGEIKSLLKNRRLIEELQKRETPPEPVLANTIFKGNDPLQDTVAYVGAFFPDLSPQEFIRVVSLLLGNRTRVALIPAEKTNEEGKTVQVEIQKEIPLIQVWQESQDAILSQCHLVTVIKNSTKAVVFDNHRLRENLKEHLERKHALYLEGQFQCVQKLGLLFDPSDKISENVMRLVIAMAAFSADDFLRDWLLEIINELERPEDAQDMLSGASENSVFRCLKETDLVKAKGKVYQRISELLRKILEEDQLQGVVDALMQGLMSARLHGSVLELVRRIKFAPGFDEFKWLRQLLDQGDQDARDQTYEYIYFSVKEMGVRGYQVLEALESWLPKEDRPSQNYSFSNQHALRLLLDLSSETLENFDPKNYGVWPTTYSLLAFKDVETAKRYLRLLTKWLFHPGMKHAFSDFGIEVDSDRLNSALIAEWDFILLAPREAAPIGKNSPASMGAKGVDSRAENTSTPNSGIDALTVRNILLQQVIAESNRAQQKTMLEYWEDLKDRMLILSNILSPVNKQYKETLWKRRLVKNLIVDFRAFHKQTITVRQQTINA